MHHTYDYRERVEEFERCDAEAKDAEEEHTTYTDEELLESDIPEVAEERETVSLTERYDMLLFGAGILSSDETNTHTNQDTEEYLTVFRSNGNMNLKKIWKSAGPM